MEAVRKYISCNAYTNFTQGLLPYVEGDSIVFPNNSTINGNYGKFVCDFLRKEDKNGTLGEFFVKEGEYRYRYMNILSDYLFTEREIRDGIVLKKVKGKNIWVPRDVNKLERYDYTPYNVSEFENINDLQYIPTDSTAVYEDKIILVADANKINKVNKRWCTWFNKPVKDWELMKDMDNYYVGVLYIPNEIKGESVPHSIKFANIIKYLEWFRINEPKVDKNSPDYDCCVQTEWDKRGGWDMYHFLESNETTKLVNNALDKIKSLKNEFDFAVPYASFGVAFNAHVRDNGIMTVYEDEYYIPKVDNDFLKARKWINLSDNGLSGKIESKLDLVRRGYSYDDNGVLPGYLVPNSGGTVYRVEAAQYTATVPYTNNGNSGNMTFTRVFTTGEVVGNSKSMKPTSKKENAKGNYYYNCSIIEEIGAEYGLTNHDSETLSGSLDNLSVDTDNITITKTKVISTANVMPIYAPVSNGSTNWSFSFTLKDDDSGDNKNVGASESINNGRSLMTKMVIPYILPQGDEGYYNVTDGYGDYITNLSTQNGKFSVDYNIGGNIQSRNTHGISIHEEYDIDLNDTYEVYFNGIGYTIGYENIKTEYVKAYSEELNLEREVSQGDLTGIYACDIDGITKSILFKRGVTSGLNFNTQDEIDIEIVRGDAAAYEHYYKLSECNTMEDLENYGNNYFNIREQ